MASTTSEGRAWAPTSPKTKGFNLKRCGYVPVWLAYTAKETNQCQEKDWWRWAEVGGGGFQEMVLLPTV